MVDQPQYSSSRSQVFMMSTPINLATQSKDYENLAMTAGKEKSYTFFFYPNFWPSANRVP